MLWISMTISLKPAISNDHTSSVPDVPAADVPSSDLIPLIGTFFPEMDLPKTRHGPTQPCR